MSQNILYICMFRVLLGDWKVNIIALILIIILDNHVLILWVPRANCISIIYPFFYIFVFIDSSFLHTVRMQKKDKLLCRVFKTREPKPVS